MTRNYWLFKSEPNEFSFDDLLEKGSQGEVWDGIRNYQARNFLRDQAKVGDYVFFYHSSCKVPAIIGSAKIIENNIADPSQFNNNSKYFDVKASQQDPRWITVKIAALKSFNRQIELKQIKADPTLADMHLVAKGSRLSIQPVSEDHWRYIELLAK